MRTQQNTHQDRDTPHTHHRQLSREFVATALYVDLVLVAALAVAPDDHLPTGGEVALLIVGGTAGLLAAHWLAFRLAVQVTTAGDWHTAARQEGVAQLAGGMGVALLAAVPFLLLEAQTTAVRTAMVLLIAPLGAAGFAIGWLRGRPWPHSLGFAVLAIAASAAVVIVKISSSH